VAHHLRRIRWDHRTVSAIIDGSVELAKRVLGQGYNSEMIWPEQPSYDEKECFIVEDTVDSLVLERAPDFLDYPRCRGRDPEASREGRGRVPSRSTERGSSLRRFLSLMSAAAACAGIARGGGSGTRDRGSRGTVLRRSSPVAGSFRFKRLLDACEPALRPERPLTPCQPGVERKELPIP
jgi:hypothetical protein